MPELRNYRLFISHAWRYHDDYDRIINLLDCTPNFKYSNYSVPWDDKFSKMTNSQLKEELEGQIRPVNCILVLAGLYVSYSEWIQFEIDFAKLLDKPIIGVMPWGSTKTPKPVSDAANLTVGWNTTSIVQAIRDYAL